MLNITYHQGTAIKMVRYAIETAQLLEWPKFRPWDTKYWEIMEQPELSFIAGGNAKLYGHFESQFGLFLFLNKT